MPCGTCSPGSWMPATGRAGSTWWCSGRTNRSWSKRKRRPRTSSPGKPVVDECRRAGARRWPRSRPCWLRCPPSPSPVRRSTITPCSWWSCGRPSPSSTPKGARLVHGQGPRAPRPRPADGGRRRRRGPGVRCLRRSRCRGSPRRGGPEALGDRAGRARLEALRDAVRGEPYSGPVILQGRASGVFFHEVMGHRVEGHRQKREDEGKTFAEHVGKSHPAGVDRRDRRPTRLRARWRRPQRAVCLRRRRAWRRSPPSWWKTASSRGS